MHPPSVARIQRAWLAHAEGAREQALVALFFAVAIGGSYVARLGTAWARALVGVALAAVVVAYVVFALLRRREAKSTRLTVRRVLFAADPALGERALRALSLVERAEGDETVGSAELANLHFSRLVGRVTTEAVKASALRYAQRLRGATLALLSLVLVAVLSFPGQVVEGLDVLFARHGRAPVALGWVGFPRLSATPPSYTREAERALVFGSNVSLPKGTVITVRGVPRVPERPIVLTDGEKEEPFASDGGGGVVARWTVRHDVTLRAAARFGDVRVDDEESIVVEVVPDEPPEVELESAPRTVRLAEVSQIDVRWTARDDHGLREVDLVMQSGAREERRVLGRFDGESRIEHGGHVVLARDAFLRRMFLPITIRVEAKDNDPLDGPKWSASAPLTVVPPAVGEAEAARLAALRRIRDGLVDLLKWRASPAAGAPAARDETALRVSEMKESVRAALSATYAGATVPRGFRSFIDGQIEKLVDARRQPTERAIEDATLAVDVALAPLGNRDAADVAKRLADVAEEAATSARFGRDTEKRQDAMSKLDVALASLEKGAANLATLGALGRDVGSVALADTARIRRARDASDLMHAELAALHLAERLRRPTPSFGATTGHGGKGGVESGRGAGRGGEGGLPPPSAADSDFDESASQVSELAAEHENALRGVESALEEARRSEPSEAERDDAKRRADTLRKAVESLPLPGQEFGTPRAAAALAREHAMAAAHDLEDLSLSDAAENAERALSVLDEADRRLDRDDPVRDGFEKARSALREARDFARQHLEARRAETEARARHSLEQASDTERDLGGRAEGLAKDPGGKDGALPRETAERLERAASIMREAAKELGEGHGDRALELQREAQRLLEQSRTGRTAAKDAEEEERSEQRESQNASEQHGGGKDLATGGEVPGPDDAARAEDFRKRVLEGLGRERSERLSPAVRRYAEGLLR